MVFLHYFSCVESFSFWNPCPKAMYTKPKHWSGGVKFVSACSCMSLAARGVLCTPSGVLLRPAPWSGRLLKAVHTAMAVSIGAFHCTLVDNHVHTREDVLGSIPSTYIFAKRFCRTLATFEKFPFKGTSFTVHYTVFQG